MIKQSYKEISLMEKQELMNELSKLENDLIELITKIKNLSFWMLVTNCISITDYLDVKNILEHLTKEELESLLDLTEKKFKSLTGK